MLHLWTVEQDHKNSPYRFVRDTDRKEDTLVNDGFGPDFAVTGMTWSAFRPSAKSGPQPTLSDKSQSSPAAFSAKYVILFTSSFCSC
ncbi:glycoside hydrolase family 125 protein [Burkholderia contaminans]|nr:glycoside hydrolase family 125 protein [Burkholderia contaminans]